MGNTPPSTDSGHFRDALGAFATGVTIVTTRAPDNQDIGLTANSFNSVSLDPPMVLWSLAKTASSLPVFLDTEYFAVHVLASDQQALSDRFARRGANKFHGQTLERGHGGVPLLPGCSARFQCRTAFRYEGGDHIIFVGEVLEFDHSERQPLLFHSGGYGKIVPRSGATGAAAPEVEISFRMDFLGYLLATAAALIARPVQTRFAAMGLSETEYYVITALAARHACAAAEIESLLAAVDRHMSDAMVQRLIDAGFVASTGAGTDALLELTASGRRIAIELFAVAKAAEEEAFEVFDPDEARLLKELLKRLNRGHDPAATGSRDS